MRREIMYRGFCRDDGGSASITVKGEKVFGDWAYGGVSICKKDKTCFIVNTCKDKLGYITHMKEVIPETVGQYTGKLSGNKYLIFEDDIIRNYGNCERRSVVVWGRSNICKIIGFGKSILDTWHSVTDEIGSYVDVIGNVWENPELVEERYNDQ